MKIAVANTKWIGTPTTACGGSHRGSCDKAHCALQEAQRHMQVSSRDVWILRSEFAKGDYPDARFKPCAMVGLSAAERITGREPDFYLFKSKAHAQSWIDDHPQMAEKWKLRQPGWKRPCSISDRIDRTGAGNSPLIWESWLALHCGLPV
jgi:hypothetical protein